jgi:flagellin
MPAYDPVNKQLLSENNYSSGVFTQALQNIATLRADNGASMSRLTFAFDNIADESTRLAKYNVKVQASASMLAHANTSTEVAQMLIRCT